VRRNEAQLVAARSWNAGDDGGMACGRQGPSEERRSNFEKNTIVKGVRLLLFYWCGPYETLVSKQIQGGSNIYIHT
jgi:hypothetical protein